MKFLELNALENEDLAKRARVITQKAGTATLELGKILAVLNARREDKTLQSYARSILGVEIDSTAYKVAVSFGLVSRGTVAETEFDEVPVRWHVVVSSIENQMERDERDETFRAQIRDQVAAVLCERPEKGHETLRAILATVKPAPEPGAGAEPSEENANPGATGAAVPVDVLSADFIRFLAKKIEAETNPEVLKLCSDGFRALADLAEGLLVERATPVHAAAPAALQAAA